MRDKDGGPAFPYSALLPDPQTRQLAGTMYADNKGMTLWDYYAAAALGVLSTENFEQFTHIANDAACIADAMLAERKKRGIGQ